MDRRTTLALALCFLIFVGWQEFYIKPRTPAKTPVTAASNTAATVNTQPTQTATAAPKSAPAAATREATTQVLQNDKSAVSLSDTGRWVRDWGLAKFRMGLSAESPSVSLEHVTHQPGNIELAFDDPSYVDVPNLQGAFTRVAGGGLEWKYEDSRMRIRRVFTPSSEYFVSATVTAEFMGTAPKYAFISINQSGPAKDPEQPDRQLLYWTENALTRTTVHNATEVAQVHTPVAYIGAQSRYFLLSVMNASAVAPKALLQPTGPSAAKISLVYPIVGNSISIPLKIYFGPKELTALRATDPLLDHTVDFGWFTVLAYPILRLMKWFYEIPFIHNYGVAIILLTLLLKLVTFPLTYKSMKSMKALARLQPQMQKLRERYKDDKEALNREMIAFMRTNGANPLAGCLPILIQMPVFFALYRVLYSSIELLHAPFALWITDLAAHDPYYVTPVILTITMYVQQKLTPTTTMDPMQAKMLQLMPVIFGVFMLWLPSGLTLYMLVNAVASIVQQLILNRVLQDSNAIAPTAVLKAR